MPGTIEDDDPGESPGVFTELRSFSFSFRRPKLDVDDFVDRLRFTGLDPQLVEEAARRLRANSRRGMRWVEARLKELEPPRKPPECQCGAALVDAAWRGRATVGCSVCGSRWGVEVINEEMESIWEVSGPTEEWRAAHPVEEYDPYGDFQPEEVLREGLPPLPEGDIEPGSFFPVAMWRGDRHAAILYAHRQMPGDFDVPGDEYGDETEQLVLGEDGEWRCTGGGGGNWVNVFDPPADLMEKYVVLGTGITGSGDDDEAIYVTGGLCSSAVAAVETTDRHGTERYAIDPGRPFFVVGIYGSGRVRVLGANGEVLPDRRGTPIEFDVGDR